MHSETRGASPNRMFIVQYTEVPFAGDDDIENTFQIVLYEGTNNIQMNYLEVTSRGSSETTAGIENLDGSIGLQYHQFDTAGKYTNLSVLYSQHFSSSHNNEAPTANAGWDQTVSAGQLVTLDGSASYDPEDDIASYQWTQRSGVMVNLSAVDPARRTFTAPEPFIGDEVLVFELEVTDGGGLKDTDTVTITVSQYGGGSGEPVISTSKASISSACGPGSNAPNQSFEIWNGGGGSLAYTVADNVEWLNCSPSNGTSTGEHDTIGVYYSTSGLSQGNYYGTITITASGAENTPYTIPVTLSVNSSDNTVYYVDRDVASSGNGTTWSEAFKTIKEALDAAQGSDIYTLPQSVRTSQSGGEADDEKEIWVKSGTYHESGLHVYEDVAIYGGFQGTEVQREDRDWLNNITTVDGSGYTSCFLLSNGCVLDGLTIMDGNANYGGGITCTSGSPTIQNCTIQDNDAISWGGGVFCNSGSSPAIINCIVSGNRAEQNGGGIACSSGSAALIDGCTISSNSAGGNGGGIFLKACSPSVTNCVVSGNNAQNGGGIACQEAASPTIVHCTIAENTAFTNGGGLYCLDGSSPTLTNCILWGDTAPSGAEIGAVNSSPQVSYSDVDQQGYESGSGNIREDPMFVDAAAGDFHLAEASPCIEAGVVNASVPMQDAEGQFRPEPSDTSPDLGAFETRSAASLSALYFPHVLSDGFWETEICIINTSETQALNGVLNSYDATGTAVSEGQALEIEPLGRREIIVGNELSNPSDIRYIVFEMESPGAVGYLKLYVDDQFRVSIPAVSHVNSGEIYVPHIASDENWVTELALVNTSSSSRAMTLEFDNGDKKYVTLAAGEHQAFTIAQLFEGAPQPGVHSAVITQGSGVIGVEMFSTDDVLGGVGLSDDAASQLHFPHIATKNGWNTGIVVYNPSEDSCTITITPYDAEGNQLTPRLETIGGKQKYVGVVLRDLALPLETEWLSVTGESAVTGFELFTQPNRIAGYTGVNIVTTNGIFPKLEKVGETGIAFVNVGEGQATVVLDAYDDEGEIIATQTITLDEFTKVVDLASDIFPESIEDATYVAYTSDKEVVGFQINSDENQVELDALENLF